MKTKPKFRWIGIATISVAVVIFILLSFVSPVFSTSRFLALLASTPSPTPPPGDSIPLKSLSNLTSLTAEVQIGVNGLINGQRAQGDLNAVVAMDDQGNSRITVTGELLGQIVAQVGGSLVGLFTPSSIDIYKMKQDTYVVINSLFPVCVKPANSQATGELEEMSPQSLLSMLTGSDVARGKLVGQEKYNGVAVKHYLINGEAFLAAAKKSGDPKLRAFGNSLWSADDAHLYIDSTTGYPVAFAGSYSGSYQPLKFQGDFDVQIEVTGVNNDPVIKLPSACNRPITP